ncbi:hypothetical protein [Dictyobacter kobayashii]|uniref:Uncharacterized protein n=1 Tax=Dictyobacter kobayashii TaxID=2014872 RepID=A0A402AFU1_9CHLR|nr:hypothetical protein [Dictyobacter kobayashii]GCE17952.1 hypothetical protein KDK_17520 [Dictyobacter kobayashii]
MSKHLCQQCGHMWVVTAAAGWFQCQRVIDTKVTKRNPIGQSVYCGAVAHCPGCLGYVLQGYEVVMCREHACLNIQRLPLMTPTRQRSFSSFTTEQQSLW